MHASSVRPPPRPWHRLLRDTVAWLLFCVAMALVGLFFTPEFGAPEAFDGVALPFVQSTAPRDDAADAAVPMAATVLLPYEPTGTQVSWAQ